MGQRRLRNAKVAVIGAGGLGAPVLTYLTAAGVGTIGIVDFDVVDVSNLQRQTVHGVADVGRSKVQSAAETMSLLDPSIVIRPIAARLDSGNVLDLLAPYDLVIDGTDNFRTRYLVNDACALLGLPYVWGSVFRFEGQVSVFWADRGPQYRDLFPTPPPPGSVPSCGEGGVLGVVCGVVGSIMATEAVKLITGVGGPLLGRVLVYDALKMSFRTIAVRRDPLAEPITRLGVVDEMPDAGVSTDSDVTVEALLALRATRPDLTIIDVREPAEHVLGIIDGARSVPMGVLTAERSLAMIRTAAAAGPVVLYCASGVRSAQAHRALLECGIDGVRTLSGGFDTWKRTEPAAAARR